MTTELENVSFHYNPKEEQAWGCIKSETFVYLDYDVQLIKTEFPVLFSQVPQKFMLWTYHKFFCGFCDDCPLIFFRLSTIFFPH